ncbi:TIM barrel protein [Paracoccus sp. R12_1]|uniref:hydroxypyruvate isomerase family protein n=1 Tax=unclassified Paracoccus (in: a-proteobacteria) TaxID=2688777 RepID=UPI001ADBF5C5|nr:MULTISPECIES: TIM barrel protein [unclassified Paracoccus (in: a-proteobacteria)]MBO9456822.1 TIM barrel protein [Paracoccus sp. R12_2]MBO9487917.1 TIM barrel protein [Paracoccus sp. R12_1]
MPRFAANLTMLFTELPMQDRFAAAADAGFQGAEILFPYDIPARDLSRAAISAGLEIVLINTPPPNWAGGPRGFAAEPGREDRFRHDFDRALRFAQALRARHIHVMAGVAEGQKAHATFLENLRWATKRAPHASLTIEPINRTDMPGYYLSDFDLASRIIAEVGAANLGLQFDAYHAQIITGDVIGTWQRVASHARHVQIAGYPGRHEPQDGQIDYPAFFAALDQSGYRGWVSAEYNPTRHTEHGLAWLPRD